MTYLDYAAATPLDPRVLEAMKPWMEEQFANPSAIYQAGQQARSAVDEARMKVAQFLGCQPTEVFFTASGTESCNWALLGTVEKQMLSGSPAHVVTSAIEHSAVLKTGQFLQQTYGVENEIIGVDPMGIVDTAALESALKEETAVVSVMMVNNEIGTIQPIAEIAEICHSKGIPLHTDACQASLYLDMKVEDLGVDLLTLNGSKVCGPKGIGVLYVKEGTALSPWSFGGGQEFGMRAGTENVPAIVGLGRALELIGDDSKTVAELRDLLWERLSALPGIERHGSANHSAPHILNVYLPDQDSETVVKKLDMAGFAVSVGSACASGKLEPSHVILALGHNEGRARSSLRISLGRQTTLVEIEAFAEHLTQML